MINIIDTFQEFRECFEDKLDLSIDDKIRIWQDCYISKYPELERKCKAYYEEYDYSWKSVANELVFKRTKDDFNKMIKAHENILEIIEEVNLNAKEVFNLDLQSKESIRLNILKEIENHSMFPNNKRFIICKKKDLQPIGEINYCDWDSRNQKCEFGIKICEVVEQGKGYGKDALYHFIDFIFRFLNLNKIELMTMIDNERSQNLYKKLGFKEIGVIRNGYFDSRTGTFQDVLYMDILKYEWDEIKNSVSI